MKGILVLVLLFVTTQIVIIQAVAAPGDLDPTFGNGGIVVTNYREVSDLHTQPDGKIIVSGSVSGSSFILRYNSNGTPDTSFGTNGLVTIQNGGVFYQSALQVDGKIVAGGRHSGFFSLMRFNTDGTLDTAFGTNGTVIMPIGSWITDLIVQTDGKIIAAGSTWISTGEFLITRYNSNGSLDAAFGSGGKVIIDLSGADDEVSTVLLQPDGKIVLGGTTALSTFGSQDYCFVRLLPNGALDSSFGIGGKVITNIIAGDILKDFALQADGKIIAAGYVGLSDTTTGYEGVALIRYDTNGSLDSSFATNGILRWTGNNFGFYAVIVQPNGKILVAGQGGLSLAVLRFNGNGSPDTTFGTNGIVVTPTASQGKKIALQPDGKIIVAGNLPGGIGLVRYLGDSTAQQRDAQFDFDGDGKSDVSVFRPSNGIWYLQQSQAGFAGIAFGQSGDKITPADFDGDGKTDIGVYRNGTWYLQRSQTGFLGIQFGASDDVPVPADYDGDGRAEVAVYRAGVWFTLNLANNQFSAVQFGLPTDKAVPADYDGDGKTDIAVYRDGIWYLQRSRDGFAAIQFGNASDKPVAADYDGDGKADVAVFRAGVWYLQRSSAGFTAVQFGSATDAPAPADYDGDGKTDIAVFRGGVWYLLRSQQGFGAVEFGAAFDQPIPAAFAPQD